MVRELIGVGIELHSIRRRGLFTLWRLKYLFKNPNDQEWDIKHIPSWFLVVSLQFLHIGLDEVSSYFCHFVTQLITLWTTHSTFKQCGMRPVHHSILQLLRDWKSQQRKKRKLATLSLFIQFAYTEDKRRFFVVIYQALHRIGAFHLFLLVFLFNYLVVLFYLLQLMMFKI